MRRWMIFLLIAVFPLTGIMTGCSSNDGPAAVTDEEHGQINEKVADEQILKDFRTLAKEADFPKEVVDYVDEEIKELGTETASIMAFELSQYLNDYFNYNTNIWGNIEKLNAYYDYPEGIDTEEIKETDLREFYNDLTASGYKLEIVEGMINPIVDYSWMLKYNDFISEDIADYFTLCSMESDQLSAKDAALVISWDELGERVLATETFLSEHPGSIAEGEASYRYTRYLWMYMLGLNNTPVVEWKTNKVKEEVLDSYNKFTEEHKNTISADVINDYLELLSDLEFVIPYDREEKYLDFDESVDELIDNAKNSL